MLEDILLYLFNCCDLIAFDFSALACVSRLCKQKTLLAPPCVIWNSMRMPTERWGNLICHSYIKPDRGYRSNVYLDRYPGKRMSIDCKLWTVETVPQNLEVLWLNIYAFQSKFIVNLQHLKKLNIKMYASSYICVENLPTSLEEIVFSGLIPLNLTPTCLPTLKTLILKNHHDDVIDLSSLPSSVDVLKLFDMRITWRRLLPSKLHTLSLVGSFIDTVSPLPILSANTSLETTPSILNLAIWELNRGPGGQLRTLKVVSPTPTRTFGDEVIYRIFPSVEHLTICDEIVINPLAEGENVKVLYLYQPDLNTTQNQLLMKLYPKLEEVQRYW